MSQTPVSEPLMALIEKAIGVYSDVFLVSVRVKPVNNIKVFIDADSGVNIDKCAKINKAMYRVMEEEAWYPDGNFSLEVSSPGVDEPLLLPRQFKKNVGRKLAIILLDDAKLEGKLTEANESGILLECSEGKNKKIIITNKVLAFEEIKQAIVQISF